MNIQQAEAIIIGSGPNGLAAGITLAQKGIATIREMEMYTFNG